MDENRGWDARHVTGEPQGSRERVDARAADPVVKRVNIGRDAPGARGSVTLGGPARIIVPVTSSSPDGLRFEVKAVGGHPHDLIEWRVDCLEAFGDTHLDGDVPGGVAELSREIAVEAALDAVLDAADRPVVATVRTADEGGSASMSDAEYVRLVAQLARRADAVDVEVHRRGAGTLIEAAHLRGARVIASHHDFARTPSYEQIVGTFHRMESLGADIVKVAYWATGPDSLIDLMNAQMWARTGLGVPVIGISMGVPGAISRIAGSALGSAATFATVGAASAPGQFSAERVREALDLMEG